MPSSRSFIPLLVLICAAFAGSSRAGSLYGFLIDPARSHATVEFSATLDSEKIGEDSDSSPIEGAFQAFYDPGTGDFETVRMTSLSSRLQNPIHLKVSKSIVAVKATVEADFHDVLMSLVLPSSDADIDESGNASIQSAAVRISGVVDYEIELKPLIGDSQKYSGSKNVEMVATDAFVYSSDPHTSVTEGRRITARFAIDDAYEYTCEAGVDHYLAVDATFVGESGPDHLFNISTRGQVGTGDSVMIAGFIIDGADPKQVMVSGWGPSLEAFGVPNVLKNPKLDVYSGLTALASNDNWVDSADKNAIIATGRPPMNDLESAVLLTLAPGPYTAILSGADGGAGNGLVAVWDVGGGKSVCSNISTRGMVGIGGNVMIAGFIVEGTVSRKVAVTGLGPSLTGFGVPDALANPVLNVLSGATVLGTNDDWEQCPDKDDLIAAGAAPLNSRESGVVLTLDPGNYTAILSGAAGGTGNGLVAVWDMTPR